MTTNKNKKYNEAMKYQKEKIAPLSKLTYKELERLKGRIEIESPKGLDDFNFAQEIKDDEFGGLEVKVFHYYPPEEKSDFLVELMRSSGINPDNIQLGESSYNTWFNISKSGHIEWPDTSFHEGDD